MNKKLFYCLLVTGLVVLGILMVGCKREGAVEVEEPRESTSQLKSMSGLMNVIEIKAERGIQTMVSIKLWCHKLWCQSLNCE